MHSGKRRDSLREYLQGIIDLEISGDATASPLHTVLAVYRQLKQYKPMNEGFVNGHHHEKRAIESEVFAI